jgi:hypothetical protein
MAAAETNEAEEAYMGLVGTTRVKEAAVTVVQTIEAMGEATAAVEAEERRLNGGGETC